METTNDDAVFGHVSHLLVSWFGMSEEEVGADTTLSELDIDSLAIVELGMAVEDELGVRFTEDEISAADTVQDLVRRIVAKGGTV